MTAVERDVLDDGEFAALQQLGRSPARGTIAANIGDRLKTLGFAREIMDTLIITEKGSARLSAGNF